MSEPDSHPAGGRRRRDEPRPAEAAAPRAGFQVETAAGGSDALAILDRGGIDLMLLDIMMPDVSGLDVLRRVRADGLRRPGCRSSW